MAVTNKYTINADVSIQSTMLILGNGSIKDDKGTEIAYFFYNGVLFMDYNKVTDNQAMQNILKEVQDYVAAAVKANPIPSNPSK